MSKAVSKTICLFLTLALLVPAFFVQAGAVSVSESAA